MLRIVTHIERLLLVHDCVIVPKFGGFVLQAVPAMQHKEEHTFRPLRKEIGFNMTLQHNDGLLPESYMQMHEVSYRQAQLMLEEDVEDIKNILQQYGKLSLGVLGSFSIGEEGQMIFHPGETDLFSVGSYGLPVFHFPVLAPLEMEREEAVLLEAVLPDSTVAEADTKQESSEEVIAREVKKVVSVPAPEKKAFVSRPVVVQSKKMYHIVIASFPSESQADEFIAGVDRNECKHVSKVVRDGKYRIYADKFDNREAAESYMATLRSNPKYKDAWLFISR